MYEQCELSIITRQSYLLPDTSRVYTLWQQNILIIYLKNNSNLICLKPKYNEQVSKLTSSRQINL